MDQNRFPEKREIVVAFTESQNRIPEKITSKKSPIGIEKKQRKTARRRTNDSVGRRIPNIFHGKIIGQQRIPHLLEKPCACGIGASQNKIHLVGFSCSILFQPFCHPSSCSVCPLIYFSVCLLPCFRPFYRWPFAPLLFKLPVSLLLFATFLFLALCS